MSDDTEHDRRRLLILDDVIDKLFGSRHKTKPLDVLEKKLEQMETLVSNLSDHDSWIGGRDLFSTWKSRLLMWWERFAEEKTTVVAETAATGKVPAAPVSKSSPRGHSAPQSLSLPSHDRPSNVDRNLPENIFKSEWPRLYSRISQSFENLSDVRSRDDCIRIHALYNNIDICFNRLISNRLIGDHQIHNTVLMMATDKLPKSMQRSFRLRNKKSLKALMTYLSDYLTKIIQTDTMGKDKDYQKLNCTLTNVEMKSDMNGGKSISSKNMPLIIPISQTIPSPDLSFAVIPPIASSESKRSSLLSLSQTVLIKKEPTQGDKTELEEGEIPEDDSSLTSIVSIVHQSTQSTTVPTNMTQSTTTSNNNTEDLTIICCHIDRQFSELPVVQLENDITGLKKLLRAVMNATVIIKPYNGQKRVLLERRIFHLATCLMSNSWFWGVHASKQTGAFINKFLRNKILEANIASGRMVLQDDGKLVMSGQQQQQQLFTKVCQTEKEDKSFQLQNNLIISEGALTPSECSTNSTSDPEMSLNHLSLNSFLASCRQKVSDFNRV